jgi:ATP-dependent Clp protease adaptor protein ClpS
MPVGSNEGGGIVPEPLRGPGTVYCCEAVSAPVRTARTGRWTQVAYPASKMADERPKTDRSVLEKTRAETREPDLYSVILLNDDYTTMDFVVQVLESVFNKGPAEAFRIMMLVHTQGQGLCGIFPWDIAETKVAATHELAQERGFPLRAVIEKV